MTVTDIRIESNYIPYSIDFYRIPIPKNHPVLIFIAPLAAILVVSTPFEVGSIVGAYVATRTDDELRETLDMDGLQETGGDGAGHILGENDPMPLING